MEIDGPARLGRSPATWWLLAMTALITAAAVTSAVRSLLKVTGVVAVTDEQALESGIGRYGFFGEQGLRIAEGISLVATLPIALSCLVVLVGLVLFRQWAREGALGVFGLGGSLLLIFSVSGVMQQPTEQRALTGLGLSLLVLAVAALTLAPGVRDDFDHREIQRQVRDREAATAARRLRSIPTQRAAIRPG